MSLDLLSLLDSWQLALRGQRKAAGTIKTYTAGPKAFLRWCESSNRLPELTKPAVQQFLAELLEGGAEPATAYARYKGLKQFAAWLADEGETDTNVLTGLKPPKLDRKLVEGLTDDQLKQLIEACKGNSLKDRRDTAIVRLMAETGIRAGELIALRVEDVDLKRGLVLIQKGKGGKGRVSPFGPQTATAIDRYLRIRKSHRLAGGPELWLGGGGKTFGYHGLDGTLKERAEMAGITDFHAHLLRNTFATRWLRANGSENGLMAVAGWSRREMIDRYAGATAADRAADESRALNLGDI